MGMRFSRGRTQLAPCRNRRYFRLMTSRAPQERLGSFFFFRRGGRFPFSGGKSFHAHFTRTHVSCRTFHGIRLPRIIGLLITGIVLGPYALDLLDPSILGISSELRQLALVIILIKAGLSLDLSTLRRVGRPAVLLSFLPATFEIAACVLFAPALLGLEDAPSGKVTLSGLLAVMSVACTVQLRMPPEVDARLSEKFGKVWLATEVALFVLVGAAVDLRYLADAGLPALLLLVIGLIFRSAGTYLSLLGTALDLRERLFPVIAYLPKATVQAAIGGVPLAMGLPCGGLILSVAVLSILVTAPLGAIGMEVACPRWITREA